jgi:hypothetical protein
MPSIAGRCDSWTTAQQQVGGPASYAAADWGFDRERRFRATGGRYRDHASWRNQDLSCAYERHRAVTTSITPRLDVYNFRPTSAKAVAVIKHCPRDRCKGAWCDPARS